MQALLESWQALEYHMDTSNSSSGSITNIEKPHVPPYCTLGYLLTWKLQLHFIKTATSEVRATLFLWPYFLFLWWTSDDLYKPFQSPWSLAFHCSQSWALFSAFFPQLDPCFFNFASFPVHIPSLQTAGLTSSPGSCWILTSHQCFSLLFFLDRNVNATQTLFLTLERSNLY